MQETQPSTPAGDQPAPAAADAGVIARVLAGDAAAIESLLAQHYGRLLSLARSVVGCEQEAQDAVQEALVSAFQRLHTVQDPSALRAWMDRIVVNASISRLRKRRLRRELALDDLLPSFDQTGHRLEPGGRWSRSPGDAAETTDTLRRLRACVDELPAGYQEVVILRDILGLSTAETAEIMGMEEGAVKVRLHRGRQALRTLMMRHEGGET